MADFTPYGYEIVEILGRNTYGGRIAYKAVNLSDRQPVVIKQFQFIKDSTWEDYKIIQQEIETLQSLEHPGIPRYLTHFDSADGICIVQEYKDAKPLSLQRSFTGDRIKEIASKILEILVYLQNRVPPVIHRDIKPENILLDDRFNVYLVDFGFSRIGEGSVNLSSLAAGTFGFMPPEQLHNLSLTKAADLYGVGATLVCLITETKSTEIGSLINLSTNSLQFDDRMSEFSVDFVRWLKRMVQPDPKQRFPNAEEALKALKSISIARFPEVNLSQAVLEFKATRLVEKLTQTIVIDNYFSDTILEGDLQVAANSKDPPHTPDRHAWISIDPKKFQGNKVKCKITVDTRKLKADSVYRRWILLHTNAALEPYKIKVRVQTASAPSSYVFISDRGNSRSFISVPTNVLRLPYPALLLSLATAFVTTVGLWVINGIFGNLLGEILNAVGKNIWPALGALLGGGLVSVYVGLGVGGVFGFLVDALLGYNKSKDFLLHGSLIGITLGGFLAFIAVISWSLADAYKNIEFWTFFIQVLVFFTLFVIGVITTIWTSIKTAKNSRNNEIKHRDTIILSRLTPASGISLGVGLMAGLSNPWVIAALAATALPVVKVIFDYDFRALKQWRQLSQRKQKEKYLIEP